MRKLAFKLRLMALVWGAFQARARKPSRSRFGRTGAPGAAIQGPTPLVGSTLPPMR